MSLTVTGLPRWLITLCRFFFRVQIAVPVPESETVRLLRKENEELRKIASSRDLKWPSGKKQKLEAFYEERFYASLKVWDEEHFPKLESALRSAREVQLRVEVPTTARNVRRQLRGSPGQVLTPHVWSVGPGALMEKTFTGSGAVAFHEAVDRAYRTGLARRQDGRWFAEVDPDEPLVWTVKGWRDSKQPDLEIRYVEVPVATVPESEEEREARLDEAARAAAEAEVKRLAVQAANSRLHARG